MKAAAEIPKRDDSEYHLLVVKINVL